MIRVFLIGVVTLGLGLSHLAAEGRSLPTFELGAGIGLGSLVSGYPYDLAKKGLSPGADTTPLTTGSAIIRIFPVDFLGLELAGDIGTVLATARGYSDLSMYDYKIVTAGPAFRFGLGSSGSGSSAIALGGGLTYNNFTYNSSFRSLLSNVSLYSVNAGLGWYARGQFIFYGSNIFFSAGIEYLSVSDTVSVSGLDMSGKILLVPLLLGFYL